MTVFAPNYYMDFKCTADKCTHNCCIGWEIGIDDATLEYYKKLGGSMGKRLTTKIAEGGTPHFILDENERCPFLNANNLCDIITELGENKLCSICSDHPRFRNFYSSATEIGLGLCCEEATRLVLTQAKKTEVIQISGDDSVQFTDEESIFFNLRSRIFEILQNRSKSISDRVCDILSVYNISLPKKTYMEWADIYINLERLDEAWTDKLSELKKYALSPITSEFDTAFEQLLIYFFYRHLADGLWDDMYKERILFCILSFDIIYVLCSVKKTKSKVLSLDDICDIARMYSSEIEYNEENIASLLETLAR